MLKQLASGSARTELVHDGATLRTYRGKVFLDAELSVRILAAGVERRAAPEACRSSAASCASARRAARASRSSTSRFSVRLRSGGERLQPDPRRPRRTLKNLFQEAGVPPWERERLPLLFSGDDLVWVPGLGIDARFQAPRGAQGLVPEWSKE